MSMRTTTTPLPLRPMVKITPSNVPPMRTPESMWALLIDVADCGDDDDTGPTPLLVGCWTPLLQPRNGDLVVRLSAPSHDQCNADPDAGPLRDSEAHGDLHVDVELMLAFGDRWERAGVWRRQGHDWPRRIAAAVRATTGLYRALAADGPGRSPDAATSLHDPFRAWPSGLFYLLTDGTLQPGDELEWERPVKGLRHTAVVRADGWLRFPDGATHSTPRRAVTALGAPTADGWAVWHRACDKQSLASLRDLYRSRHYGTLR